MRQLDGTGFLDRDLVSYTHVWHGSGLAWCASAIITIPAPLFTYALIQKITYAQNQSHATIRQVAGDEVLYHVKLGLKDPNTLQDKNSKVTGKMTVSGAQAANVSENMP
jgi:hypothetical protein